MGLGRQDGDHMLAAGFTVGKGLNRGSQGGQCSLEPWPRLPQLLRQNLNHLRAEQGLEEAERDEGLEMEAKGTGRMGPGGTTQGQGY